MENKIKLFDYINADVSTQREIEALVKNNIDAHGPYTGNFKSLYEYCCGDAGRLLRNTLKGYRSELDVLSRLQRLNPHQDWRFVDDDAGYFKLDYEPTHQPDLINKYGDTVEVKGLGISKESSATFFSWVKKEELWFKWAHNANKLIIIDRIKGLATVLSKEMFEDNVHKLEDGNWEVEFENCIHLYC